MVVLKSKRSGFYFREFGEWVSEPHNARRFTCESEARAFARREHLDDVLALRPEPSLLEFDLAA
jgi:hypothetical protein